MRRPHFETWVKKELLNRAGFASFNLRKIAAYAQSINDDVFAAELLLYAHQTNCLARLSSLIYDEDLRREYDSVEQHLGPRSIERLALRGTPMMSLPEVYRSVLFAYDQAYHAPEVASEEKRRLHLEARLAMLQTGISPTEVARELGLDKGNMHAFLVRGETHRFNLDTARQIEHFLSKKLPGDSQKKLGTVRFVTSNSAIDSTDNQMSLF